MRQPLFIVWDYFPNRLPNHSLTVSMIPPPVTASRSSSDNSPVADAFSLSKSACACSSVSSLPYSFTMARTSSGDLTPPRQLFQHFLIHRCFSF